MDLHGLLLRIELSSLTWPDRYFSAGRYLLQYKRPDVDAYRLQYIAIPYSSKFSWSA